MTANRVQTNEFSYPGGGTTAGLVFFSSSTTAGNLLVLAIAHNSAGTALISAVDDTSNGAWTLAVNGSTAVAPGASIWYRENDVGLTPTQSITIHKTSSAIVHRTTLLEYSGMSTAGALDGTTHNEVTSSVVTNDIVPTAASDVFVHIATNKARAVTWKSTSAGWDLVSNFGSTSPLAYSVWDRSAGDSSGVSVSVTQGWVGLSTTLRSAMAAFMPPGSTVPPPSGSARPQFTLMGAGR